MNVNYGAACATPLLFRTYGLASRLVIEPLEADASD